MLIVTVIILFGIVVNGVDINYATSGAGIRGFSYTATDPDGVSPNTDYQFDCDEEKQTDDKIVPDGGCTTTTDSCCRKDSWGKEGTTTGMDGTFLAEDVQPGGEYALYEITKAAIVFCGCIDLQSTGSLYYTNKGISQVNDIAVSVSQAYPQQPDDSCTGYQFVADLDDVKLILPAGQTIGFNIEGNKYCAEESETWATEFILKGIPIETDEPTMAPSNKPSTSPTTATPTMAPTSQCKGEVTWGDPHFRLMAVDNDNVAQFNYQGLGWFFYIAPCDMSNFEHFPFFLMSYHTRCYWRGNPKGCINDNKLILNTKDTPWIIKFSYKDLEIETGSGTYKVNEVDNGNINTKKKYKEKNPLVIEYDDGQSYPPQKGTVKIFYEKDVIVVQLYDVQFNALPRKCNRNEMSGLECGDNECEDLVIDIRNKGSWTYFTCPSCLRNIACGLMGKYYRGDCKQSQLNDKDDRCSQILVGTDGDYYTDNGKGVPGKASGDDVYGLMADTWMYDEVVKYMSTNHGYTINFAKEKNTLFKHKKNQHPQGRSLDITAEDASYYDGYCKNNITHIDIVKETCRQHTVVEYAKCCKEIGICNLLWLGCIEDYCSCTEPDAAKPANITDAWCLNEIISKSMNTTCGVDALYPTATPTSAPTPSPTGLVAGLPQGEKAADLIWLYLIFVVLFVVIAGVAYWYYRKKNGGKASFQDDVETGVPNTGVGY
eukprot:CAMPEP_0201595374 /NCGR_PEP_ID=MMETSP0190_2-20130828/191152_1 /ASSEMBLY_ACC=CAM_ASM_000263 /TAXON_ID=37353 /ORGANISM="Rosalina sp." /LENGTH=712 /DNA_ID=CAMNT_0048055329 /DNA_START=111 /DNA_END=2249 /DNA_ORIENTATION=+